MGQIAAIRPWFYQRKLVTRLEGMKLAVPQSRSGGRYLLLSLQSFFPRKILSADADNWKCIARS